MPEAAFLQYQIDWVNDHAQVKLIEKSRRIGISWCEAGDCSLEAAKINGEDSWYVGYNQDMAREFIEDVGNWARYYGLAAGAIENYFEEDEDNGVVKKILAFRVTFASGYKVCALSSRPSNLRGKQGRIILDEFAFHPDTKALLKAALAMLIWGGRVHIISTHDGDENAFNELINEIRAGKKKYSLHRVTFREAVAQGLYRRVCFRLGKEWSAEAEARWVEDIYAQYGADADEELDCIPAHGSGAYLSRALIESCMTAAIPVVRWACDSEFVFLPSPVRTAAALDFCNDEILPLLRGLDSNRPTFISADFGRSGDLSTRIPWQEMGNIYQALFLLELRNVPFEQQEQIDVFVIERLPRFRGGAYDARGNGQAHAEKMAQKFGASRIHQVMLSVPWYRENTPPGKQAFEDRSILLPLDPDVTDDLRALKVSKGVAQIPDDYVGRGRDGGQRHADAAIAVMLGVFAFRNCDAGPMEYQSVGTRRSAGGATRNGGDENRTGYRQNVNDRRRPRRVKGVW